ncbi:MAG: FAD-dependent oxidoreductase [Planctomycetes bacterium]|nr:FAD-dependent oxidoreductase [Planctomycetota bacterium]
MAKPAILVVDDEPEVLRAIARDMRKRYGEDYRVLRASSGREGVDALVELRERGEPVALILSDQRMPKMDGTEFLAEARRLYPGSKRALLTAYADTNAAIASINESQIDYYLLKPWDPPEERLYPVADDLLEDWRAGYRPGYGGLRVVGHRWSAQTHDVKEFLARNQIPYQFMDIEASEEARAVLGPDSGSARDRLPIVLLPGGKRLQAPTTDSLAAEIGMRTEAKAEFYDLAIVGAGPAGLAAAVYGASEGLKTVLIERQAPGGQAGTSSLIENYLGFPSGLTGADLARRAVTQATRFGVEILAPAEVASMAVDGPYKRLTLKSGKQVACHALMLSMGVTWKQLPAPGAERLAGRGLFYGAAMTEAMGCTDKQVYIVGAGNSAGQAAMFFAEHAGKVTVLVRGDSLATKMSNYLVERLEAHPKIEILTQTEIAECHGEEGLEALTLRNRRNAETMKVDTSYVFIFIGAEPGTAWLSDCVARDKRGFILTGPSLSAEQLKQWPLKRDPFLLECSVPGVFAAGDVRSESIKRVASAVGEGSVSVAFIHRHLAEL